ncbi:MAG: bifunctional diaminohydroxyphosphoribosylaminopyrimidine deaminase/5-amino-6-(5-phosphoribosylamino)uracil reductase RibD [Microscillaceae bacterium]
MEKLKFEEKENIWMQRALELALLGQGRVSPNPMVGCVIVHQGQIIGEGWHQRYGAAHAEVKALEQVQNPGLLPEATVYVNLEPCAHFGKTPPCADRLIRERVKRVVVANTDPNPLVAGKGLARLQAAGIAVGQGLEAAEGRKLNRRFFTFFEKQRPYIILKWAETADGYLARLNYDSKWISNALARTFVHKWRAEEDAVLIGPNTAFYDNPQLTVRDWEGPSPLRVVVDRQGRLPAHLHLWNGKAPTLVYTQNPVLQIPGAEVVCLPKEDFLPALLHNLYERRVQSLLIEGGAALLQTFLQAGYWDEARRIQSPQVFGAGIAAPHLPGAWTYHREWEGDQAYFYFAEK